MKATRGADILARGGLGMALVALVFLVLAGPAPAADNELKQNSSLAFVPASAGYYGQVQRLGEIFRTVKESRAWARIQAMPGFELGWQTLLEQFDESGEFAELRDWYAAPENQELTAFGLDLLAHELFFYADPHWGDIGVLLQQVNREMAGLRGGEEGGEVQLMKFLAANRERLRLAPLVYGAKVSDGERAQRQLDRLEKQLREFIPNEGMWKNRLVREKLAGGNFLTLRLDGSQVPWQAFPLENFGEAADDAEALFKHLEKQTLSISVGIRQGYAIFSLAASNQHLAELGQGPLLADAADFAPVLPHAAQRIVAVHYLSPEYATKAAEANAAQIAQIASLVELGLAANGGIDPGLLDELRADSEKLQARLAQEPLGGAAEVGIEFLTPRGLEGYAYSLGKLRPGVIDSRLAILNHLGGSPIFFWAGRQGLTPADYDELSTFGQRLFYYAERLTLSNLDADDQEQYRKVKKSLAPLADKLDATLRRDILPALADGQGALVFDADESSLQPHQALPPAKQPLPLPELALVLGVSDAESLERGVVAVFDLAQQALDALHEALPDDVPEFQLSAPQQETTPLGKLAWYALPPELGLDAKITPIGGLGKKFAVLSTSPDQCRRLLAEKSFQFAGPLASAPEKLVSAVRFDMASLIDAVQPWAGYALTNFAPPEEGGDAPNAASQAITLEHVNGVLDVARCFRSFGLVRYLSQGRLETHYELHFEDLK